MKKIFKIIFGLIGGAILLVIVGVTVFVIMLTGGKIQTPDYVLADDTSSSSYISYLVGESLKDTKTEGTIEISFDEKELNYLLNAILREVKAKEDLGPIEIAYINATIDATSGLSIFIPVKVFFIKTVIKASVKVTQDGETITGEVIDLKVGRITLISPIAKKILKMKIVEEQIKNILIAAGVTADVDFGVSSYTITTDKLQEMILEELKTDANVDLYETVLTIFLSEDRALNISIGESDKAKFTINVARMSYDKDIHGEDDIDYDINSVVIKVTQMLNSGALTETNLNSAFRYLLLGYDRIKDQDLVVVNKIDFSSVGITNKPAYKGIIPVGTLTMESVFNAITPADLLTNPGWFTIKVAESDLNEIFSGMALLGTSFAFPYLENDIYHVSYITLSSFYVDIFNDMLEIKLVLDLNGKETIIKTAFSGTKNQGLLLELDFTELMFGQIAGSAADRKKIFSYLADSVKKEEWIDFDVNNQKVILNFTEMISANPILQAVLMPTGTKETQLIGENLLANGYIELKMQISLP